MIEMALGDVRYDPPPWFPLRMILVHLSSDSKYGLLEVAIQGWRFVHKSSEANAFLG